MNLDLKTTPLKFHRKLEAVFSVFLKTSILHTHGFRIKGTICEISNNGGQNITILRFLVVISFRNTFLSKLHTENKFT